MQRVFLIILACLALFVAGCGSDSDTSSTAAGTDTTAESEAPQSEETTEEEGQAGEEEASKEDEPPQEKQGYLPKVKVPKGPPPKQLVTEDLKKGSGATAEAGDEIGVEYIGVLYKTGEVFDANWELEPFVFTLGNGEVIKGWDQGVEGMKVGGERKLIIPPALAYGDEGVFPSIPANATLVFQVKLNEVN
jgi:FKBP-type peptidyl-prolyl cis-trans isomerase